MCCYDTKDYIISNGLLISFAVFFTITEARNEALKQSINETEEANQALRQEIERLQEMPGVRFTTKRFVK